MAPRGRLSTWYLTTAALLLATLKATGSLTSAEPIPKTFVYNPPSNGSPPPDVMALLAAGKTSGLPYLTGTRYQVKQEPHYALGTLPYFTSGEFPARHRSAHSPDILQKSVLQKPDHGMNLQWESVKSKSDEKQNSSGFNARIQSEGQEHVIETTGQEQEEEILEPNIKITDPQPARLTMETNAISEIEITTISTTDSSSMATAGQGNYQESEQTTVKDTSKLDYVTDNHGSVEESTLIIQYEETTTESSQPEEETTIKSIQSEEIPTSESTQSEEVIRTERTQSEEISTSESTQFEEETTTESKQPEEETMSENTQSEEALTTESTQSEEILTTESTQSEEVLTTESTQSEEVLTTESIQSEEVLTTNRTQYKEETSSKSTQAEEELTENRQLEELTTTDSPVDMTTQEEADGQKTTSNSIDGYSNDESQSATPSTNTSISLIPNSFISNDPEPGDNTSSNVMPSSDTSNNVTPSSTTTPSSTIQNVNSNINTNIIEPIDDTASNVTPSSDTSNNVTPSITTTPSSTIQNVNSNINTNINANINTINRARKNDEAQKETEDLPPGVTEEMVIRDSYNFESLKMKPSEERETEEEAYAQGDHEKQMKMAETGINTIFFTVDEDSKDDDGQIQVKVGKRLNHHQRNQNAIDKNSKDVYQYHFQDPATGTYKFGYGDNHQWRHEERTDDGVVLGRYGWHDANGRQHTTHFVADAGGYRIVQPGQKITMHLPLPTAPPTRSDSNKPQPSLITTAKPTSPPASITTASFPITSVSTTITLSSHPTSSKPTINYPGTIDELIRPGQDVTAIAGRPPIAYPLPQPTVSHRPGSWVFVSPPSSSRPFVRPPYRPLRPYPNRPIKSPFRPVNRPRPKPNRIRPLKPLQPNVQKASNSHKQPNENSTDSEESDNDDENELNPALPTKLDFIGQLQTFLNNQMKRPLQQTNQIQSAESTVPDKVPPVLKPTESDNMGNFSPSELVMFLKLMNSLKADSQVPLVVSKPVSSNPAMPATYLQPPSMHLPISSNQETSGSSNHEVQHNEKFPPYPLDYAFMDEDYAMTGSRPFVPNNQNDKPTNEKTQMQALYNVNRPSSVGSVPDMTSGNMHQTPDEIIGSVTWNFPSLVPEVTLHTNYKDSTGETGVQPSTNIDGNSGNSTKNPDELIEDTTIGLLSTTSRPTASPLITLRTSINTGMPKSSTRLTTTLPPPITEITSTSSPEFSHQNFWGELLKRIYYWPNTGPTTIQ